MLKSDLHLHCSADPKDKILYSDKELIDHASKLGFKVLAITCHDYQHYTKEIVKHAIKKKILLIPGMEKTINGKHVLLYNFKKKELDKIKNFEDIIKYKRKNNLVICPHPFLPIPSSLFLNFKKYQYLFDAVEYCHFYTTTTNHNLITKFLTKLPFVGNSDAHFLWQINHTYSFINAKPTINSVIRAIKEGSVKVHSKPLTHFKATIHTLKMLKSIFNHKL